jgi:predicted dienelactone hydrolase
MAERRAVALSLSFALAVAAACATGACAGDAVPATTSAAPGDDSGVVDASSRSTTDARTAPSADDGGGADAAPEREAAADASEDGGDAMGPYGQDGPIAFTVQTASLTNAGRTFTVTAYLPAAAGGRAPPVVSLSPGLLQPASAYMVYGKRFASHGIAMLVRDDPGALGVTTDVAADIAYTVATWMPTALGAKVDAGNVGLIGHSRGGKATLLAAEGALKGHVKAWFGLDPVDASAFGGGGPQARDGIAAIGVPTAYLGASVASTCSPVADNYEVLFAAGVGPSVKLTGIGAGHTQLEDGTACSACGLCTPAGTADSATVLAYALRYATAFFARELLGDARVGAGFEGAGVAIDVAGGRVQVTVK